MAWVDRKFGFASEAAERGASTVEFAILLPAFLATFIASFEMSLLLSRQVMLERAVDVSVREIRLDSGNTVTRNALRNAICDRARILPDCRQNMVVELTLVDQTSYTLPAADAACVNRETSIVPSTPFATSRANRLVLLRACFVVDPFMPGTLMANRLVVSEEDQTIQMVAATAFMVEP